MTQTNREKQKFGLMSLWYASSFYLTHTHKKSTSAISRKTDSRFESLDADYFW
jgi:hypothetical protein